MEKFSKNTNSAMKNVLSRMSHKLSKSKQEDLKVRLQYGCKLNCQKVSRSNTDIESGDQQKLCENCVHEEQLNKFNQWFPKLSEENKQYCIFGFVHRLSSHIDILKHLSRIMAPTFRKDYMYTCCRVTTNLETDEPVTGLQQTLPSNFSNKLIGSILKCYDDMSTRSKLKFLVAVLQSCNIQLIYLVYNFITNLVQADHTHKLPLSDTNQNIPGSNENTTEWSNILESCSKRGIILHQFKDIIHHLPAPLAKYILNMLDEVSLRNAQKVSRKWYRLVKQLMKEIILSQQVIEEAILLQGGVLQGVNPTYAKDVDVAVPNVCSETWSVIYNSEPIVTTPSLSEISFKTAYSGISTRNVIMEEKNIYCGPYNVMMLQNKVNNNRVIHTDGGELIAISTDDRKIHFIDSTTGKDIGPTIKGHAGSIYCLHLCEKKRIILSGSYDTSIRCWSIDNGKCLKIYHGHRGTVLCLRVFKDAVVSGSKDNSCRVWDLESGKCLKIMRHTKSVRSVAISGELVVSGCDGGEVKVWHQATGNLIKRLKGHSSSIMCLKFDRWHIVSGSKDGYVMAWSSQGDHSQCLAVYKHPKEVWCIELLYLRIITGSSDGRIRIWNLLTGMCCRIMRGNSQSDPILHLIPIANRITVNTHSKILALMFEEIEWNYDLENDSVPPQYQYTVSNHQSSKKMSSLNPSENKIGRDSNINGNYSNKFSFRQKYEGNSKMTRMGLLEGSKRLPFSAKVTKTNHLAVSKQNLRKWLSHTAQGSSRSRNKMTHSSQNNRGTWSKWKKKDANWHQKFKEENEVELNTFMNKNAAISNNVSETDENNENLKTDENTEQELSLVRRLSWAFDPPKVLGSNEGSLLETKSLLRSQIRSKTKVKIPEFIHLTRQAYQQQQSKLTHVTSASRTQRSFSSPAKIDSRTRISINQTYISQFKDSDENEENSDEEPNDEPKTRVMTKTTMLTKFITQYTKTKAKFEMQSRKIKSTIPKGWTMNPEPTWFLLEPDLKYDIIRPFTAFTQSAKAGSDMAMRRGIYSSGPYIKPIQRLVPSKQLMEKIALFQASYHRRCESQQQDNLLQGRVRLCDDPLRDYAEFHLKTHKEENQEIAEMERKRKCLEMEQEQKLEQKQITHWLAFSKGLLRSSESPFYNKFVTQRQPRLIRSNCK